MLRSIPLLSAALTVLLPLVAGAEGADPGVASPLIDFQVGTGSSPQDYATAIKVFLGLTMLTLAPAMLLAVTSFTRIAIVLSLLRTAVGVQGLPPNRILVGMALFMTVFTMSPVIQQIDVNALTPYEAGEISGKEAATAAMNPLRRFMLAHTRLSDLELFLGLSGADRPETAEEVSTFTIVPAFMLSELKTAFQMGAMLFLPFLIIDIIVASVLMSMGMMMLPPVMVSLPVKLFVFILADGWTLVLKSLAESVMLPLTEVF
jgi:flagellar biosynthetic protein FliP